MTYIFIYFLKAEKQRKHFGRKPFLVCPKNDHINFQSTVSSSNCTSHAAQGSSCSHQLLGWGDVTEHPWRVRCCVSFTQWRAWPLPSSPCTTQSPSIFQGHEVKLRCRHHSSGQPALKWRRSLPAEGVTIMKSLVENTFFQVKGLQLSMFGADLTTAILLMGKWA